MPWRHIEVAWLELHSFSVLDGAEWSPSWLSHFTLGTESPVPSELEAGWALQLVWTLCGRDKSLASSGILTPDCLAGSLVTILTTLNWLQSERRKNLRKERKDKVQSNSVIGSLRGPNTLCCYKQMSQQVKCMPKGKEKKFRTKCSPACLLQLLNVKDMNYSKFKLQLKLRNKNYSSTNANFHTGLI